jgi:transketolase
MVKAVTGTQRAIDGLCVNTIRTLAMDAVQAANSGHPGAPMGLAAAAYVLWTRVLKHNPKNPEWVDRDRFVLSGGHASALLYSLLNLTGYKLSLKEIKNFRQWGSQTPGHPEFGHTPGVETTTGPLGQGFANAVGMAMAERHLAAVFNRGSQKIVDHHTYVMCGDGDLMEGIASEAASMAGHLGMGRLICIYDDNKISIEGSTDIAFTENVAARFRAYRWQVLQVQDGIDLKAIETALKEARAEKAKPTLIALRTNIAYGSPNKQDTHGAHGAPLGVDEVRLTKENLGWPKNKKFYVPVEVRKAFGKCTDKGRRAETAWNKKFKAYAKKYPELAQNWQTAIAGTLPQRWDAGIPTFRDGKAIATRAASGQVLNALAENLPTLMGGSADLAPSNNTIIKASFDFQKDSYAGRNIRFGVREHAMGAVLSGMALHKGVRPNLSGVCRLLPACHTAGSFDETTGHLCVYPRQRGGRRRRSHPPAGGTRGGAEGHSRIDRYSTGRCHRNSRSLESCHQDNRRPGGLDFEPPEPAGAGSHLLSIRHRISQRRLYPVGYQRQTRCHIDRQRFGGVHLSGGQKCPCQTGGVRPGGEHAQLGAV